MGEPVVRHHECEARLKWTEYFNSIGIYKPLDMIKHVEMNPQIGDQIVADVIDAIHKDREEHNGQGS